MHWAAALAADAAHYVRAGVRRTTLPAAAAAAAAVPAAGVVVAKPALVSPAAAASAAAGSDDGRGGRYSFELCLERGRWRCCFGARGGSRALWPAPGEHLVGRGGEAIGKRLPCTCCCCKQVCLRPLCPLPCLTPVHEHGTQKGAE